MTTPLLVPHRSGLLATGGLLAGLPPVAVFGYLIVDWVLVPTILIGIALVRATPHERTWLLETLLRRASG